MRDVGEVCEGVCTGLEEWDGAWRRDESAFDFGVAVGRHRGARAVIKER